jgi:hypothetical protein
MCWALGSCVPSGVRPLPSREEPDALRYHVTFVRAPQPALEVGILRGGERAPRDFLFTQPGGVDQVLAFGEDGSERELPVRGRHAGFFTVRLPDGEVEMALLWRHPERLVTMFLAANDRSLLALKMAVEGLTPPQVSAATGVAEADIRAAVESCVADGLVLSP